MGDILLGLLRPLEWINARLTRLGSALGALALALMVALAIKVVGALLIAAMLIIPAATARGFARSPEAMALIATGLGLASVAGGLGMSLQADTPAGPSIVSVAAAGFVLAASIGRMRRA